MMLLYGLIWVSVSVAVTTGIIVTHSLWPLWAFLIPACISFNDVKER